MTKPVVALTRCKDYSEKSLEESLAEILEHSGFPDVRDKTVLLKPNILTGAAPEKAVTTHPEFVRAVIKEVKIRGARRILVGDSPGVGSADSAGKKCGIKEVVLQEGAEWTVFQDSVTRSNPNGKKQTRFSPAAILEQADIVISLPKMKTHEMMYYTGAIKNLFGLIPGLNKSRFHMNFPEKEDFASLIVDLFDTIKPDFAIIDGILAMEGPGPGSGYPREVNLLGASANLLALDWAIASIMGYQPESIPILKEALDRQIWMESPRDIVYPLLKPEENVISNYKRVKILKDTGFIKKVLPEGVYQFLRNLYVPRPFFIHRKCIRCGKCLEICPASALCFTGKGKKKKVSIDYSRCIRCYCCHEVCPVEAIRIGRL